MKALQYYRIQRENRSNPTVLKLNEFLQECKTFTVKKWISFYDIETVFQMVLIDENISDITTEILIQLKVRIEAIQKKFKSKAMPLKALKVLINSAKKSIVI